MAPGLRGYNNFDPADGIPDSVAFVFIAMGPAALAPGAEYAIETLRKVGGYRGRVFVLTDQPDCFVHHGSKNYKLNTFVSYVDPPVASEDHRAQYRIIKTQIFEYVPLDVEYAVYLDTDILTTKVHCVADFLRTNLFTGNSGAWPAEMAIRLRWLRGQGPHLGSFVIRRNHSEALLQRWAHEFSRSEVFDRESFAKAATVLYGLAAPETIDEAAVSRRNRFVGPLLGGDTFLRRDLTPQRVCFVHISQARCNALGADGVDQALRGVVPGYADDFCQRQNSLLGRAERTLEKFGVAKRKKTCEDKMVHYAAMPLRMRVFTAVEAILAMLLLILTVLAWRSYYSHQPGCWPRRRPKKNGNHAKPAK